MNEKLERTICHQVNGTFMRFKLNFLDNHHKNSIKQWKLFINLTLILLNKSI